MSKTKKSQNHHSNVAAVATVAGVADGAGVAAGAAGAAISPDNLVRQAGRAAVWLAGGAVDRLAGGAVVISCYEKENIMEAWLIFSLLEIRT